MEVNDIRDLKFKLFSILTIGLGKLENLLKTFRVVSKNMGNRYSMR